jgi:tetratricopeptide (TPR) repeat protein
LHVETLSRGATSVNIGHDIDFTLRAFPNHPRALMSMAKLSRREGRAKPLGANYSIECYFERAIRFRPDDPMPYMIAGVHFAQVGQRQTAISYLDRARELSNDDANLHYNLGLGYLDVGLTDKALEHARRAYAAGFPLPGLRDRLRALGAWKE